MNMTAAARSNRAAPMTVARGGREGAPIPVTPTFSSPKAFGSKEAGLGKAMSLASNPIGREIRIGHQPTSPTTHITSFSNPDRAQFMRGIKVDVPYTGKVLQPRTKAETSSGKDTMAPTAPIRVENAPHTDKAIAKAKALEILQGRNTVTLFERPKKVNPIEAPKQTSEVTIAQVNAVTEGKRMPVSQEVVKAPIKQTVAKAPSLSEIGLKVAKTEKPASPVITQPEVARPVEKPIQTIQELRQKEATAKDTSLSQVRAALRLVESSAPQIDLTNPQLPDMIKPIFLPSERVVSTHGNPDTQKKPTRKLSPLEKIQEKAIRREIPKPYEPLLKNIGKVKEVAQSIEMPKFTDKDIEKDILTKYLDKHILTDANSKALTKAQVETNNEIKKRMVTHMTSPEKKDGGSQLETQLLGDTGATAEQVAMQKIEALVKETRVTIQMAKLNGQDVSLIEQQALTRLHERVQEAGLLVIFIKVKTNITQEIVSGVQEGTNAPEAPKVIPVASAEEDEEKNTAPQKKGKFKIELDTFADKFRRIFMKSRARRALEKAKEKGRKAVSAAEIAKEIGTYQYHFTKSEPVRYTKQADGSITETLAALNQSVQVAATVDEAERIVEDQIKAKPPVRTTGKLRTEPRGLLDLIRVLGYPKELMEQQLAA